MSNFQQFLIEAVQNNRQLTDEQQGVVKLIFTAIAHDIRNRLAMQLQATNVSLLPAYGNRNNKYTSNVVYVTDKIGSPDGRPRKHSTGIELTIQPGRNNEYKVSFVCRGRDNLQSYGPVVKQNGSMIEGDIRNIITTEVEQVDIDTGSQLGFVYKFKVDDKVRNQLDRVQQNVNKQKSALNNKQYRDSLNLLYKVSNSRHGKDENVRLATERTLAKIDKDVLTDGSRKLRVKLIKDPAFAKIKRIIEAAQMSIQITKVAFTERSIVIPVVIDKVKYKLYINPASVILIDQVDNDHGTTVYGYNVGSKQFVYASNAKNETIEAGEARMKQFIKDHKIDKVLYAIANVDIESLMSR